MKKKKTGGRKKGTPNKTTAEVREILTAVLSDVIDKETILADLKKLDPKDRLQAVDRLLKHILPAPMDELLKLTDEDLDRLADHIKHKYFKP